MSGTPRIETERLVLRLPRLEDAEAAAEQLADPEVMRYLGGRTVPREDVPAVIERWFGRWEANGFGHFAVERREDGRSLIHEENLRSQRLARRLGCRSGETVTLFDSGSPAVVWVHPE
jgi:RimJ/RimL family protein N-acetyltransferase